MALATEVEAPDVPGLGGETSSILLRRALPPSNSSLSFLTLILGGILATAGVAVVVVDVDVEVVAAAAADVFSGGLPEAAAVGSSFFFCTTVTLISRPRPIDADCRTVSFLPLASAGVVASLAGSSGLSLDFSVTLFLLADASELIGGGGAPSWSIVGSWSIDGSSSSISSSSEAAAATAVVPGALASLAVALREAMGFTEIEEGIFLTSSEVGILLVDPDVG